LWNLCPKPPAEKSNEPICGSWQLKPPQKNKYKKATILENFQDGCFFSFSRNMKAVFPTEIFYSDIEKLFVRNGDINTDWRQKKILSPLYDPRIQRIAITKKTDR
jgi:hypothetical protein